VLTYEDVRGFLSAGLEAKGYASVNPAGTGGNDLPMPRIDVGPFAIERLTKLTPGPLVFATVGNGAGLTLEQTYDQVFITIRAIGPQHDYTSAERLAQDIDLLFLAVGSNGLIGNTRVLFINRTGGSPQLVDLDESDRYHFQTTYITPASTGL
jgi:hypothetical protein